MRAEYRRRRQAAVKAQAIDTAATAAAAAGIGLIGLLGGLIALLH